MVPLFSLIEGRPFQRAEWMNTAALRRNSTYGLRVTKSPSSLVSFCFSSYFSVNHCCFACVSFYISLLFFIRHFLQFPVLLVLSRTSPPKILLSKLAPGPSSSVLPTSLYPFLPCTSLPFCIFFSRTSLRSCTFHVCPALTIPLQKSC